MLLKKSNQVKSPTQKGHISEKLQINMLEIELQPLNSIFFVKKTFFFLELSQYKKKKADFFRVSLFACELEKIHKSDKHLGNGYVECSGFLPPSHFAWNS